MARSHKQWPGYYYHRCRCGYPSHNSPTLRTELCGAVLPRADHEPVRRCSEPPRLLRIVRPNDGE